MVAMFEDPKELRHTINVSKLDAESHANFVNEIASKTRAVARSRYDVFADGVEEFDGGSYADSVNAIESESHAAMGSRYDVLDQF